MQILIKDAIAYAEFLGTADINFAAAALVDLHAKEEGLDAAQLVANSWNNCAGMDYHDEETTRVFLATASDYLDAGVSTF